MKHGNYQHGWLHRYCDELSFNGPWSSFGVFHKDKTIVCWTLSKFQITAPIVPAKGQLQTTEWNLCAENEIFFLGVISASTPPFGERYKSRLWCLQIGRGNSRSQYFSHRAELLKCIWREVTRSEEPF